MVFREQNKTKFVQTGSACVTAIDEWYAAYRPQQLGTVDYTRFSTTSANLSCYTGGTTSFAKPTTGPIVDCTSNNFSFNLYSSPCTSTGTTYSGQNCVKIRENPPFSASARCQEFIAPTLPPPPLENLDAATLSSTATLPLPAILGLSIGGFFLLVLLLWRWRRGRGV
jgi:hypothetical protein